MPGGGGADVRIRKRSVCSSSDIGELCLALGRLCLCFILSAGCPGRLQHPSGSRPVDI